MPADNEPDLDEIEITVRSPSRDGLHAEAAKTAVAYYGQDAGLRWAPGLVRLVGIGLGDGGVPCWEMTIRCTTEDQYERLQGESPQALGL